LLIVEHVLIKVQFYLPISLKYISLMMKPLRTTALLLVTVVQFLTSVSQTAKSQDAECFMVTSSGKVMNLSGICGDQSVKPKTPAASKDIFQAPIKRREHGIPVIDVTFNGKKTFEMLVDTGASSTVLTPQVAAALGFSPTGKVMVDSPTDRNVEMALGKVNSIEVAGAVQQNTAVTVAPALDTGLLGQNFFGSYDVTFKQDVVEFRVRKK